MARQKKVDVSGMFVIGEIKPWNTTSIEDDIRESEPFHEEESWQQAWDDVIGREFGFEVVREIRKEEVAYFKSMKVCSKVFM